MLQVEQIFIPLLIDHETVFHHLRNIVLSFLLSVAIRVTKSKPHNIKVIVQITQLKNQK